MNLFAYAAITITALAVVGIIVFAIFLIALVVLIVHFNRNRPEDWS